MSGLNLNSPAPVNRQTNPMSGLSRSLVSIKVGRQISGLFGRLLPPKRTPTHTRTPIPTRTFFSALLAILLTALCLSGAWASPDQWIFDRSSGGTAKLSELRGPGREFVMLVSWCSFCPSCRKVEHQIADTAARFQGKVPIYVLSVDRRDQPFQIETFLQSSKLKLHAVLDRPNQVTDELQLLTTATAIIFDSKNRVRYRGAFLDKTGPVAEQALQELLSGKEVSQPTRPECGCTFKKRGAEETK